MFSNKSYSRAEAEAIIMNFLDNRSWKYSNGTMLQMTEKQAQNVTKKLINAINENGGTAASLNERFMIGWLAQNGIHLA